MDLINSCNRVLGTSRQSTLTIARYPSLTVISGTCGGGKNTLLAGITLHTPKEDNHIILTETMGEHASVLLKGAATYSEIFTFDIVKVVDVIKSSPAKNIFIEQYHNLGDWDQPVKDMRTLAELSKELDKNITICVYRRKEKI